MTADIRTAAQREADRRYPHTGRVDQTALVEGALRVGFKKGAVWAAERVTPTREQIAELHLEHWVFDAEYRGTDHGLEIWVSVCDCDWESSVWSTQEAAKREHGEHFADALAVLIAGLTEGSE